MQPLGSSMLNLDLSLYNVFNYIVYMYNESTKVQCSMITVVHYDTHVHALKNKKYTDASLKASLWSVGATTTWFRKQIA